MPGKVGLRVTKAAEVNDAVDPRLLRGPAKVPGGSKVHLIEAGAAGHAVDEVVGNVYAGQCLRKDWTVEYVADGDLDLVRPGAGSNSRLAANEHANAVTFSDEAGCQSSADIPGRAGDEDGLLGH